MTLPVRSHPAAKREFNEAADFYDLERLGLGSDFIDRVEHAVGQIRKHPEAAPVVLGSVRRQLVTKFPFSVIYSVIEGTVVVLAVAHHRRRPFYWLSRTEPSERE
jgi:toxin ParE1/3/4